MSALREGEVQVSSERLEMLRYLYHRPTTDQAITEAMKEFIKLAEPGGDVKLETLVAIARQQTEAESHDRRST